jgi:GNAT superfamily N-acetyltransferase
MTGSIRKAQASDVDRMVELSEQKRIEYQAYQPTFWRKASNSREKQAPFLTRLIDRDNVIALVHEREGAVDGFLIAALVEAPPVYDPGGLTCLIDDFAVAGADWQGAGAALLAEASRQAQERSAAQVVVVCGHKDGPKREMLGASGLSIASEWYVGEIR